MSQTLEQFAEKCHRTLTEEPGPAGRKKVCALLEDALKDSAFVDKYLGSETSDRKILYEDPELGFCILAHHYDGARTSNPHDHGPYWAIYGQAMGETIMSDFSLVEPAGEGKRGKVRYRAQLHAEARHGACL